MKKHYSTLLLVILMATPAFTKLIASTDCSGKKPYYPSYYCDCEEQRKKNKLIYDEFTNKFDTIITDTTWFASNTERFLSGFTAYLYSDVDITLTAMHLCSSTPQRDPNDLMHFYFEYVIKSNQARDFTADAITQKLQEFGVEAQEVPMVVGIAPAEPGKEVRFICTPYGHGPASTCEDCLPLLPNMVFVSSHPNDVYELDPQQIAEDAEVSIEWQSEYWADFAILRGACQNIENDVYTDLFDVADVFETFFPDEDNNYTLTYTMDSELLKAARANNEKLYLYFGHFEETVGRIRFNVVTNSSEPTDPSGPATNLDQLTTNTPAAKLVLDANGMLYIVRGNETYTITGQKR